MITIKDYLKNLSSMTTDEKLNVIDRIEVWMEKYPELMASVKSWEDAPVKDFDEGLLLCSCLRRAHSFVDAAYQFNVKKCLSMIEMTLKEVIRIANPGGPRTETEKKTIKVKAFVPKQPAPDEDGNVKNITEADRKRMMEEALEEEAKNDKWRPQGLDGYIKLLSKETQQECLNVKRKYYMPRTEYRTRLESYVENPDATTEQRKEMAQALDNVNQELAAFWAKVDLEYKKVTGQEVPTEPEKVKKLSEYTKEDIDNLEDAETKEKLTMARVENNKKYLRRGDLQPCDEVREQLILRAREMAEWGIPLTKRQIANLKKYDVPVEESSESNSDDDEDAEAEGTTTTEAGNKKEETPDKSPKESDSAATDKTLFNQED